MPELGLSSKYDYSTATSNRKKSIFLVIGVIRIRPRGVRGDENVGSRVTGGTVCAKSATLPRAHSASYAHCLPIKRCCPAEPWYKLTLNLKRKGYRSSSREMVLGSADTLPIHQFYNCLRVRRNANTFNWKYSDILLHVLRTHVNP